MSTPPNNDRSRWETLWRDTVWELADDGTWSLLRSTSRVPLVVVTA